jgi:hypothetical protein
MRRNLLAALTVALVAAPAAARIVVPDLSPVEKVALAEIVLTGAVTAIEKDTVIAPDAQGNKVAHKLAVIKVEKGLLGADKLTHVKVAFVPDSDPKVFVRPPGRGGYQPVNLAVGHAGVFFLAKSPDGDFYTINPALAPLDSKAANYKAQADLATKAASVLTDPAKALKAEKAEDRFFAANVLVTKYRSWPGTKETEIVLVPQEESRAVLMALGTGNWKPDPNDLNPMHGFRQLDLTEKDGWKYPTVKPGEDFVAKTKEAYLQWLDGPGKDYRIKKLVPKKEKQP